MFSLRVVCWFFFSKDFLERGERREKERVRNTDMLEKHRLVASAICPNHIPNLQPRYVPRLGIEPAAFCFELQHPTYWATLVRAVCLFLIISSPLSILELSCQVLWKISWLFDSHFIDSLVRFGKNKDFFIIFYLSIHNRIYVSFI